MRIPLLFLAVAALATPAAHAEPLAELQAIVLKCREAHRAQPRTEVFFSEPLKAWVKRQHEPPLIAYDVRADAPGEAAGFIAVTHTVRSGRADSEAAAAALAEADLQPLRVTRRFNFAHRAGRWELVDGRTTVGPLSNPAATTLDRAAIERLPPPLASCH